MIGAGPAGVATAVTLARRGHHVIVFDKATFPRDKCCGDGLTALALRELERLGLDPSQVPNWIDIGEAWLRSSSGREVCLPFPPTGRFAAIAPRLDLDAALVHLARATPGITVIEGATCTDIEQLPDEVCVTVTRTDGESRFTADWVVAADGMWSNVRKKLGLTPRGYLGDWHAFRQYARNVTGPARERLLVWFEDDLLPGYAWSFPLPGNRVNIGIGILRDGTRRVRDMGSLWKDFLDRPHVREALGPDVVFEDRHTAWPIPARIDTAVPAVGRVLFVGDAVMACDIMTGEGIGQALLTGRLAGEAIIEHSGSTDHSGVERARLVRETYRRNLTQHLYMDHAISKVLARILARRRGARGAIAIVARSGLRGRRQFARWMFEDEPRAIILTPRRWHRRILRSPGAYAD